VIFNITGHVTVLFLCGTELYEIV